jgi:pimeloyl-ACP methyl ester carboxylesterase
VPDPIAARAGTIAGPPELTADWIAPLHRQSGVRDDLRTLIRGIDRGEMHRVADVLSTFDRPVRLVWGTEDPFFTLDLGRRIAAGIPGAVLEEVPGARCFVPLDAPGRVADAIRRVQTA